MTGEIIEQDRVAFRWTPRVPKEWEITEAWSFGDPGPEFQPGKKPIHLMLHEHQNGICTYCRQWVDAMHVDHIVPRSEGGTDDLSNITGACRRCNSAKGKRSAEWMHENVRAKRIAYEMMHAVGGVL